MVCNHSCEIQTTKTLAAMLDDRNNRTYYNSFVNGHPTWRWWRQLQTIYKTEIFYISLQEVLVLYTSVFFFNFWKWAGNLVTSWRWLNMLIVFFTVNFSHFHYSIIQGVYKALRVLMGSMRISCFFFYKATSIKKMIYILPTDLAILLSHFLCLSLSKLSGK